MVFPWLRPSPFSLNHLLQVRELSINIPQNLKPKIRTILNTKLWRYNNSTERNKMYLNNFKRISILCWHNYFYFLVKQVLETWLKSLEISTLTVWVVCEHHRRPLVSGIEHFVMRHLSSQPQICFDSTQHWWSWTSTYCYTLNLRTCVSMSKCLGKGGLTDGCKNVTI